MGTHRHTERAHKLFIQSKENQSENNYKIPQFNFLVILSSMLFWIFWLSKWGWRDGEGGTHTSCNAMGMGNEGKSEKNPTRIWIWIFIIH